MKAGWKRTTIDAVCDVINGGTPKTGVAEYWDGSHQWITPAEMGKRATPYIGQTERTITDAGMQNSSARLLPEQSVILSSRAPIGHLAINTTPMATNQGCKGLVPRNGLDSKYLYYYLTSIVPLLNDLGTGTTFKELSGGKLKEVPVPVAPLPEQHRIVAILDEAFDGIATARANAEKNRQNARALFESHLQSIFTQRGEGWVEKTIEEVCIIGDGNHSSNYPRKEELVEAGIPFIRATNLIAGRISGADMRFLSSQKHAQLKKGHLKTGDILITNRGEIGKTAIVDSAYNNSNLNSQIAWLRCRDSMNNKFLFYVLNSGGIQEYFQSSKSGTALQQFTIKQLKELRVLSPPTTKQQAIVEQLDTISKETQRLETLYQQKLAALDELKKSLLHQAFSGQI